MYKTSRTEEEFRISLYHNKQSMHSGINETFNLLIQIFFPKLKQHIQLIISNCEKCLTTKYERKPIKPKFRLTETPVEKNNTIHGK